jgi:hypothetical protein
VPTGPDVRRLEVKYGNVEQLRGKIIPHEEIEE